jgi:glycosyltransferase involved in cell wall biosynthesis
VPFLFMSGCLFALYYNDAIALVTAANGPDRHLPNDGVPAQAMVSRRTDQASAEPRERARQRTIAHACFRAIALKTIGLMPEIIRDDTLLAAAHLRNAAKKLVNARRKTSTPRSGTSTDSPPSCAAIRDRAVEIGWPESGELLLICGHYQDRVPLGRVVEERRRRGFACVAICYDLVHTIHPEWDENPFAKIAWDCIVADLLDCTDRVLCISEYTRSHLVSFSRATGREKPDAQLIRLGCDALPRTSAATLPPELAGRRFMLNVGSIRKRRNIGALIRIWEDLAAQADFDVDLVIVGNSTEESAISEVTGSRLLGQRIHWFDNCPDDVLVLLYQSAEVLLHPGCAEGWGLSVTEALAAGTLVVASDEGAIPEAAEGTVRLLPATDSDLWRQTILELASSPPPRPAPLRTATWDSTAAAIVSHLVDIADTRIA